jgi:serine/threonine protein kinase
MNSHKRTAAGQCGATQQLPKVAIMDVGERCRRPCVSLLLLLLPLFACQCLTYTGTVTYMSPERLENKPYNFKADIWCAQQMRTVHCWHCAVGMVVPPRQLPDASLGVCNCCCADQLP